MSEMKEASETKVTQLAPRRLKLGINGHGYNVWRITPEDDTPVEAMSDRHYWAHVANKFRPGDILQVVPEHFEYFAEFMVKEVAPLYAIVSHIHTRDLQRKSDDAPKGYEVRWRGPSAKYGVVKGKDVIKDGFAEKADAVEWLNETFFKAA